MSRHRAQALRGRPDRTRRQREGHLPGLAPTARVILPVAELRIVPVALRIIVAAALLGPFGSDARAVDGVASPREMSGGDNRIAPVGPFERSACGDSPAVLPPPILLPAQDEPEPEDLPLDEGEEGDDCGDGPDSVEDSVDQA